MIPMPHSSGHVPDGDGAPSNYTGWFVLEDAGVGRKRVALALLLAHTSAASC